MSSVGDHDHRILISWVDILTAYCFYACVCIGLMEGALRITEVILGISDSRMYSPLLYN